MSANPNLTGEVPGFRLLGLVSLYQSSGWGWPARLYICERCCAIVARADGLDCRALHRAWHEQHDEQLTEDVLEGRTSIPPIRVLGEGEQSDG